MPSPWLPVAALVVIGAAFAALTQRVAWRIGRSPNHFGAGYTVHDFVGRVYRVGGGILLVFLIARAIAPEVDIQVGLIQALAQSSLAWLGLVTMVAGGALILAAQVAMGASWRIGLDRERTELVTSGLFAFSRNPTFVGMIAVVLGAFLVAPNVVTGIVLAAAWIAFSVQIRMEEEHLRRMHGPTYDAYRAAVPRWIGPRGHTPMEPATHGSSVDHG